MAALGGVNSASGYMQAMVAQDLQLLSNCHTTLKHDSTLRKEPSILGWLCSAESAAQGTGAFMNGYQNGLSWQSCSCFLVRRTRLAVAKTELVRSGRLPLIRFITCEQRYGVVSTTSDGDGSL